MILDRAHLIVHDDEEAFQIMMLNLNLKKNSMFNHLIFINPMALKERQDNRKFFVLDMPYILLDTYRQA